MIRRVLLCLGMLLAGTGWVNAQTREEKVRNDRKKIEAEGFWIYNDLAKGLAEARRTRKPLLVTLRCIPCQECVKLDDDLVNRDPRVRPLLDQFVRVRIVSTNGLDLSLFQFDTDQSFAAFLLNADGTIYGRFGTRSHRTFWSDDLSIDGLARALQAALDLHAQYPRNKASLAGKKGPAAEIASPEKYPLLKERYGPKLNYEGQVVQSCIHCHQIGDAQRKLYRTRKEAIPEQVLFPYPHPKILGLIMDPREKATVLRVEEKSLADEAGFRRGDVIVRLEGQPLLSIADIQWVLHRAAAGGATLKAEVQRGNRLEKLTLTLPPGWRRRGDISWRVSTWGLRAMATGGMLVQPLPPDERKNAGLSDKAMALRVKGIGAGNGPHGAAMRSGFRRGDVLVSFDGRTDLVRETDLIAHALQKHRPGETIPVLVLRDGKKINLKLPMQE